MKNKKTKILMSLALVVAFAVILSTTAIGATYAKFTQGVTGDANVQAAGFLITGNTTNLSTSLMIAPGETKTVNLTIGYFSQVNTVISIAGAQEVSGYGVLDMSATNAWTTFKNGFDTWKTDNHITGTPAVPTNFADMFTIAIAPASGSATGTTLAEQLAYVIRNSTGSTPLAGIGAEIGAMAADAPSALSVSFKVSVQWNHFSDEWDTYVGNKIAERALDTSIPGDRTSGINLDLGITVTQVAADWSAMPAISSGT